MKKWRDKAFTFLEGFPYPWGNDYIKVCLNFHEQGSCNTIMDLHELKLMVDWKLFLNIFVIKIYVFILEKKTRNTKFHKWLKIYKRVQGFKDYNV